MKTKKIYKTKLGGWHTLKCEICYEMARRGYSSESRYWDDNFDGNLKPVKYRLVKCIPKNRPKAA